MWVRAVSWYYSECLWITKTVGDFKLRVKSCNLFEEHKMKSGFHKEYAGCKLLNSYTPTWIYLTRPKTDEQSSKWNWFHTKESLKKFQVQNRARPFHPPTVSSFRTNFQNVISDDLEIRSSFHFSAQTLAFHLLS